MGQPVPGDQRHWIVHNNTASTERASMPGSSTAPKVRQPEEGERRCRYHIHYSIFLGNMLACWSIWVGFGVLLVQRGKARRKRGPNDPSTRPKHNCQPQPDEKHGIQ